MDAASALHDHDAEEQIVTKWRALFQLTVLCLAMVIGAFGSGLLPLYAALSQRQLNLFNSLGTGLLLGTALAVIIPEGIHSLYHSMDDEEEVIHHHEESIHHGHSHGAANEYMSNETLIGVALISGFLLMMFLDHMACCGGSGGHMHGHGGHSSHHHHHHHHKHASSPAEPDRGSLNGEDAMDCEKQGLTSNIDGIEMVTSPMSSGSASSSSSSSSSGGHHANSGLARKKSFDSKHARSLIKKRATVTIGLLVHAAADGLALGATKSQNVANDWSHVELVVFFAIMMHKVPAAFALSVYLRSSGLDSDGIRRNLMWFALAAPLGAMVTFLLLHKGFLGAGTISESIVAFCILFSGGTFLYVSLVHTFQELPKEKDGEISKKHFLAIVFGCILPIILAAGHEH